MGWGPDRRERTLYPDSLKLSRQLYADFLAHQYGSGNVLHTPGNIPVVHTTDLEPHLRVTIPGAVRYIFVVVTPEPSYPYSQDKSKDNHRSTMRKMAKLADETAKFGGAVIHQQHLVSAGGLLLTKHVIEEVAYNRLSTPAGQERLNQYAVQIPREQLKWGREIDWLTLGNKLREELGF